MLDTVAVVVLLLVVIGNVLAYTKSGSAGVHAWWHSKLIGGGG